MNGSRALLTIAKGTGRGGTQKHTGPAWGSKGVWQAQPKSQVHFGCNGRSGNTSQCAGHPIRVDSAGFTLLAAAAVHEALSWPNVGAGVELVFSGVDPAPWAESRCAVLNVTAAAAGTTAVITMQPGCHTSYACKCAGS